MHCSHASPHITTTAHRRLLSVLLLLLSVLLLSSSHLLHISSLSNGLALLPPMGWSTWNTFRCDYTEVDLRGIADTLISSGMAAAGYTHLNIDDCWEASERDPATGNLQFNTTKFPSGLLAFADYLHARNLSFGLYTSSGPYTCMGYPGSWQHEQQDAKQFAQWGVDYLKLDCCYQFNTTDRATAFSAMSAALLQSGRSITYSCDSDELILAENNHEYPVNWAPPLCNLARIHWDIWDSWQSISDILSAATNLAQYSQAGYWNDMDILTVGMGQQTMDEYRSHFALWCVLSSPLIAGNDIRQMSEQVRRLLTHRAAIAINQDQLARSANMIRRSIDGTVETWAKPLYDPNSTITTTTFTTSSSVQDSMPYSYARSSSRAARHLPHRHSPLAASLSASSSLSSPLTDLPQPNFIPMPYHAVVLLNRAAYTQSLFLDFHDLFDHKLCPHPTPAPYVATVVDVWTGDVIGVFTENVTIADVASHAVAFITVRLHTNQTSTAQ